MVRLPIVKLEDIILTTLQCNSVYFLVHMGDGSVSIVLWWIVCIGTLGKWSDKSSHRSTSQ